MRELGERLAFREAMKAVVSGAMITNFRFESSVFTDMRIMKKHKMRGLHST